MGSHIAGAGPPFEPQEGDRYTNLATGLEWIRLDDQWAPIIPTTDPPVDPEDPKPDPPGLHELLQSDMRDPHVSPPDGVPTSYDWSQHPRLGLGLNGGGSWANAWGQIYSSNNPATNTLVQVGNLQLWILLAGKWQRLVDCQPSGDRGIDAGYFRSDYAGNITKPEDPLRLLDGTRAGEPDPAYNMHFFPAGRVQLPQGYQAIVGCFDARLVLQAPNGVDDRAQSRFIASCGGDYYTGEANQPPRGDWAEGRFRKVGNDWTTYTCHAGTIPPGNLPPIALASGGAVEPEPDPDPVDPGDPPIPTGDWAMPSGVVRIMPVGDSITWHEANDASGWATMPARFAAAGLNVVTVGSETGRNGIKHCGVGGWCMDDTNNACTHRPGTKDAFHAGGIVQHIVEWCDAYKPHIIVLNAGANDTWTKRTGTQAVQALDVCLGLIRDHLPGCMVLVTFARSWKDSPTLNSADLGGALKGTEQVVTAKAASMNVRLFNAYQGFSGEGSGHWLDYVHPSEQGTALMMTNTYAAIMALRT